MNHKKQSFIVLLTLLIVTCLLHVHCAGSLQDTNKKTQKTDEFQETIKNLIKDYNKNYWEIEKLMVQKLDETGTDYFIKNNLYPMLGRFESTQKSYCQICEQLNVFTNGELLTMYLNLNDTVNVRKQYEKMQSKNYAFIYKEFHKYEDSGKRLESEHISIKFDKRVEKYAIDLFTHVNAIEKFITQEWNGLISPQKIIITLLYSDGMVPAEPLLNSMYIPVKSPGNRSEYTAGIVIHELFHIISISMLTPKVNYAIDWNMNSFRVLHEGYGQLIQRKFMTEYNERRNVTDEYFTSRKKIDDYSKYLLHSNVFNVKKLKTDWFKLYTDQGLNVNAYDVSNSFVYFLEDKYGQEKLKILFLPLANIAEETWVEYVERYFGKNIDALIKEWKQSLSMQR